MKDASPKSSRIKALERENDRLRKMNRAKALVLSILAHNALPSLYHMKNITGNSLGKWEEMTNEELKKCAVLMSESSDSLYKLSENILEWTRSQSGFSTSKTSRINVFDVVNDEIDLYKLMLEDKKLTVDIQIDEQFTVKSVLPLFRLILQNIFSNAIKFSHEGGAIVFKNLKNEGGWAIVVEDHGVGMDEEKLHALKSRSSVFTTRGTNSEEGYGLGLLMVEDFLAQLGGHMEIKSEKDKGTSVSIWFNS